MPTNRVALCNPDASALHVVCSGCLSQGSKWKLKISRRKKCSQKYFQDRHTAFKCSLLSSQSIQPIKEPVEFYTIKHYMNCLYSKFLF